MAGNGEVPDDHFLPPDFFGDASDLYTPHWGQDLDYTQSGNVTSPVVFLSSNPTVGSSFDCLEVVPPGPDYRNDGDLNGDCWGLGIWNNQTGDPNTAVAEQTQSYASEPFQRNETPPQQLLDSQCAQITPPSTQHCHHRVVKREYSPTQNHSQHSFIVPQLQCDPSLTATPFASISQIPIPDAAAPPSPTSPVRLKRTASSIASPSTSESTVAAPSKPKKRMIKQNPNAAKTPMTARQQALAQLIDAEGTGIYHQHIPSAEVAAANHADIMAMYTRSPGDCTFPALDETFPTTDIAAREYVRRLFDAIWDWTDYGEMRKTLGEDNMTAWEEAEKLPEGHPRREMLLRQIPSRAMQQKKVLSRVLSDYIVEAICWRLLKYARKAQQGTATVPPWSGADGA